MGLSTLAEVTRTGHAEGPALVIIGSVVTLRGKLSWFAGAEAAQGRSD